MGELLAAQEKQKLKEAKDAAAELRKELNKPMSLSQLLNVCEQRLSRQYMMDNRSDTAQKVWDIITVEVNDEGDKDAGVRPTKWSSKVLQDRFGKEEKKYTELMRQLNRMKTSGASVEEIDEYKEKHSW